MTNSGSSVYPAQLDDYTNPGTANQEDEAGYSHAALHSQVHDAIENIETTLGTTAGTSVLKDFSAGDFPLRVDSGGTLQSAIVGGTITSPLINGTVTGTTIFTNFPQVGGTPSGTADLVNKNYVDSSGVVTYVGLNDNALINGNMDVWQRLNAEAAFTSASRTVNSDDTYLMDRWILLSDGNDIVDVSPATDKPDGSQYSAKFQVETANKKFGICQIIESRDAVKLDNGTVSLSFQAKTTTGKEIANLRAAVLSWSSTADSVTSDVVSAWGGVGTTPTFATNWTAENTPADLALTTSWTKYQIDGIVIDTATVNNIAVFIWVDDVDASVDDEFYLTQVKLNRGATAADFNPKSFDEEMARCMRYYEQSWGHGVAPNYSQWTHASNVNGYAICDFSYRKRIVATVNNVTIYAGTVANVIYNINTGGTSAVTIDGVGHASDKGISLYALTDFTANTAYAYNWIANMEL